MAQTAFVEGHETRSVRCQPDRAQAEFRGTRVDGLPRVLSQFVLCRHLEELHETLHARFYLYERGLTPNGVSIHNSDAENTPEVSGLSFS